jgi:geranylgeranyl pyrophosphate synthase
LNQVNDMIIDAETTAFLGHVEEALKAALADATGDQPRGDMLMIAARHLCIGGGGKRIRPLLVHCFGRALGVSDGRLVEAGAASELIHSASLLHDDVVDNGMFRRGRPTVNSLWGNVVAVMTGDMVLTVALQRLAAVHPKLMHDALACIADMTRGTIAELEGRGDLDMALERMHFIADAKTGALFGWCGLAAATLAGDDEARPRLGQFGRRLGVAFQIADDVKDLTGGDKGKPPFADLASKTPSLPLLLAARKDATVRRRIQDAWAFGSMTQERLRELGAAVLGTGALEDAVQRMKEEISAALELFQPYVETAGGAELVRWAHQLSAAFEERGAHEGHPVERRIAASEQHAV